MIKYLTCPTPYTKHFWNKSCSNSLKELRGKRNFQGEVPVSVTSTPFLGLPGNSNHVAFTEHLSDRCRTTNSPPNHLPKDPVGNCTPGIKENTSVKYLCVQVVYTELWMKIKIETICSYWNTGRTFTF